MRNIIVIMGGPTVGMDAWEPLQVDDNATDDEINRDAHDMCVEHYNSYGYEGGGDDKFEEEFGSDIEMEYDYYFEDYNPEKHDGYCIGGGTFQDQFDRWNKG